MQWNQPPARGPTSSLSQKVEGLATGLSQVTQLLTNMAGGFNGGFGGQTIVGDGSVWGPNTYGKGSNKGKGKGKGKGLGKGSGKGSPPPPPPPQPDPEWQQQRRKKAKWMCNWKDCESGLNRPDNADCYKCLRPKGLAMSPPLQSSKNPTAGSSAREGGPPADEPQPRKRTRNARKKESEEKAKAGAATPAKSTPPAPPAAPTEPADDADMDSDDEEAAIPTLAKDEVALLKSCGLVPIAAASPLTTTFAKPKPKEVKVTPEEEVASACKKSDGLIDAQANVDYFKAEIETVTGDAAKARLLPILKASLKEEEEKVAALTAKPGKAVTVASLQEKRSTEVRVEEERVAKNTKNREAAQARYERYMGVLGKQQALLNLRMDALREAYTESASAWNAMDQEMSKAHVAKLREWDTRISSADKATGGMLANTNLQDAAGTAAKTAAEDSFEAALVAPLPKKMRKNSPPDCELTIEWTEADLPEAKNVSPEQTQCLSAIMYNIRAWQRNGAIPVQYGMLAQGFGCKDEEVMPWFRSVVGKTLWERFYANRVVKCTDYAPTQVGMIVREALDRVRDTLDNAKDSKKTQELAAQAFAKHSADAKKRKAEEAHEDDI